MYKWDAYVSGSKLLLKGSKGGVRMSALLKTGRKLHWKGLVFIMNENVKARMAEVSRVTGETDILVKLNLDGSGKADIDTGIGFFDHMLNSFARHGLFDLTVKVKGDLEVDCHHSIEDTGIVLGQAIKEAVGDKKGIKRFGECILPMDETLMLCEIGRAHV